MALGAEMNDQGNEWYVPIEVLLPVTYASK